MRLTIQKPQHIFKVGQRSADFPVNKTQKVQWHKQLQHISIDHRQITERQLFAGNALRGQQQAPAALGGARGGGGRGEEAVSRASRFAAALLAGCASVIPDAGNRPAASTPAPAAKPACKP